MRLPAKLSLPLIVLAVAGLAGCTAGAPLPSSADGAGVPNAPGRAGASDRGDAGRRDETGAGAVLPGEPSTSAATAALVTRSRDQRAAGDLGGAAATIERALTIAPDVAVLWVELGEIRRDQGEGALAEEMARKALTLTGQDTSVAARARRLIR